MIDDPAALTKALTNQVKLFEADLRERLEGPLEDVKARWIVEHNEARKRERTAQPWTDFSSDRITQAAVAWVLTTVFVRFCEDNELLEPVWFSGPGSRADEASNRQDAFIREQAAINPDVTVRDWVLNAVDYLDSTPATAALVDSYSPIHMICPSADACRELIGFWRSTDSSGRKDWEFSDPELSTRFLGDLYQNLSESAKKKYALLQTPEFVEEFILDRTLTPALRETKASELRLIDPTCGSGHFLLGSFARILNELYVEHPSMTTSGRVQMALDAVRGVDLNPFAVAITRFRLVVVAMMEAGNKNLDRDTSDFTIMVAVGDSLLHGQINGPVALANDDLNLEVSSEQQEFVYADENQELLNEILRIDYYDVVVGNPPYIEANDIAINRRYRAIYASCYKQLTLTVPFMERFFQLAKSNSRAGHIGQITSNSFMKRDFGVKLVENFLVKEIDLTHIIDSEGAHIPGHNVKGTPTCILIGRNRRPGRESIRCVLSLGKREETRGTPGTGPYWSSIVEHLDDRTYEDEWIAVTDLDREQLSTHPWSLTGGPAISLTTLLRKATTKVDDVVSQIGRTTVVGEDEAWFAPPTLVKATNGCDFVAPLVVGSSVRDFAIGALPNVWWPYSDVLKNLFLPEDHALPTRILWPNRRILEERTVFGKTLIQRNRPWYDHLETYRSKLRTRLSIAFAFVATHNHFVLDRGGKAFKQSAPVLKLQDSTALGSHLELLGVLNSSTACFWMKQHSQPKGGAAEVDFLRTYEFTGTMLKDFPLPSNRPTDIAGVLDQLAQDANGFTPAVALEADGYATRREALDAYEKQHSFIRTRMIALQEELDWQVYQSYGLTKNEYIYAQDVPETALGERAFEIVLARRIAAGEGSSEWFSRHGSAPITELPVHWPEDYRALVEQRISLIEADKNIALLERPEYKRRWSGQTWKEQEAKEVREWLCDRLEEGKFWFEAETPTTRSVANLADFVARDDEFMEVLQLHAGIREPDVVKVLTKLVSAEAVPHLAAYRYRAPGLRKRADWEHTWTLQRQEDKGIYHPPPAGQDPPIPVPPKYTTADFAKTEYWANRGKLDVPKERFILYPDVVRGLDDTLRLGWAGWDHAQQALALVNLIEEAKADGQPDQALVPLAAGLEELEPWLNQWHGEYHPDYGEAPAMLFTAILDELCIELGQTRNQLHDWRPASSGSRRIAKKASS